MVGYFAEKFVISLLFGQVVSTLSRELAFVMKDDKSSSDSMEFDPLGTGYLYSTLFLGIADLVLFATAVYQM